MNDRERQHIGLKQVWSLSQAAFKRNKDSPIDPKERVPVTIILSVFILVGVGLVGGGWYLYDDTQNFVKSAAVADGEVVGFERRESTSSERRSVSYYPVVKYRLPSGELVSFESNVSTAGLGSVELGEQVSVLYDPLNPREARINSFMDLYFFSTLLFLIGAAFTLLPIPTLMKCIRTPKSE